MVLTEIAAGLGDEYVDTRAIAARSASAVSATSNPRGIQLGRCRVPRPPRRSTSCRCAADTPCIRCLIRHEGKRPVLPPVRRGRVHRSSAQLRLRRLGQIAAMAPPQFRGPAALPVRRPMERTQLALPELPPHLRRHRRVLPPPPHRQRRAPLPRPVDYRPATNTTTRR